jgi:hypothetical protein
MENYLKISNKGEIDINAFKLIGASSKRGDESKIGFFGSGIKYSIAYLLRNNIPFKCFSGKNEIQFSSNPKKFRDKDFSVICINGEETSMTTDMGIDWEIWYIIREFYSNAIDEGEHEITSVQFGDIAPESDKTIIYIKCTKETDKIINEWNLYFSDSRNDLMYYDSHGNKLYSGGSDKIVYRKGIQCGYFPETKSLFHYDLAWVEINESRVIKSDWDFCWNLRKYLQHIKDKKVISHILSNIRGSWEAELDWKQSSHYFSNQWFECIGKKWLVRENTAGYFEEELQMFPCLILPDNLVEGLKNAFGDQVRVMGEASDGTYKSGIINRVSNEKQKFLLKEVMRFFDEIKYTISYPIQLCLFENENQMGQALDETIYLSVKLFDRGRREIAKVIIEENEHLKTKFKDETREFQNHFINLFLTQLEERNSYFL